MLVAVLLCLGVVLGSPSPRFSHLALSLTPESYPGADTWLSVQFRLPGGYFSDKYYHNLTVTVPANYEFAAACRMAVLSDCGELVRENCVFDGLHVTGVLGGRLEPGQTCSVIFGVRVPLYVDPGEPGDTEWSVALAGHTTEMPYRLMTAGLLPGVSGYVLNPSSGLLSEIIFEFILPQSVDESVEFTVLVPSGYEVICDLGFRSETLRCVDAPVLGFGKTHGPGSRHSVIMTVRNPTAETTYPFDWGLQLGQSIRGYFSTQKVVGHFTTFAGTCVFTSASLPGSCDVSVTLEDAVVTGDKLYLLLPFGFGGVDADLVLDLTGKSVGDVIQHTFANIQRAAFQPPAVADFAVLHVDSARAVRRSGEFTLARVIGTTAVTLSEESGVRAAGVRGSVKLVLTSSAYGVNSGLISSTSLDLSDVISVFPLSMRSYVIFRNGNMEFTWPTDSSAGDTVTIVLEGIMFPEELGGASASVSVELFDEIGDLLEQGVSNNSPISRRLDIALGVDCSPDELGDSSITCNAVKVYYADQANLVRGSAQLIGGPGVLAGDVLEVTTGEGFVVTNVAVEGVTGGTVTLNSATAAEYVFPVAVTTGFTVLVTVNNPSSLADEDALKWYFRIRRASVYQYRFDLGWIPFSLVRGVQSVTLSSLVTPDVWQMNTVRLEFSLGAIGLDAADFLVLQAPTGFVYPTDCLVGVQVSGIGSDISLEQLYLGRLDAAASAASWVVSCVGDANKAKLRLGVDELLAETVYIVDIRVKNSDSERGNGYWRILTYDRDDAVLFRHFAWITKPYAVNVPGAQLLPETARVGDYMWVYFWVRGTEDWPQDSLIYIQVPESVGVKVRCAGEGHFRVDSVNASCAGSDTLAVVKLGEAVSKGGVVLVGLRVLVGVGATGGVTPWWKIKVSAPGGVLMTASSDVQGWVRQSAGTQRGIDKVSGVLVDSKLVVTFQASKAISTTALAEIRLRSPPGFKFTCGGTAGLSAGSVHGFNDVEKAPARVVRCVNGVSDADYNDVAIPVKGLVISDGFQGKRAFAIPVVIPKVVSRAVPNVWTVETYDGQAVVEFGRFILIN